MFLCPICFAPANQSMIRLGAFGKASPIEVHEACVPRARELARSAVQGTVKVGGGALLKWARVKVAARHPVLAAGLEKFAEAFFDKG